MGVFGAFLTRHLSFKDMASRTTREHWYIFSEKVVEIQTQRELARLISKFSQKVEANVLL